MQEYKATLKRVIDGSTVILNVDIGEGQIQEQRVRIIGIQTENIMKQYRSSFKGSDGMVAKMLVLKWFIERSSELTLKTETIDICGRVLGEIFALGDPVNIAEFMKVKYYRNDNWKIEKQEELKEDWFEGEEVTIPGGDVLPIFHIWGKFVFLGYKSNVL